MNTNEVKGIEEKVFVDLKNEINRTQPDLRVLPVMPDPAALAKVLEVRQLSLVGPSVDLTLFTDLVRLADEFSLAVTSLSVKRSGANVVASVILSHYVD